MSPETATTAAAELSPTAAERVPEAPPDACLLWHKRDLRVADHAALAAATTRYESVLPVFVFDPYFYGDRSLACDARIQFLHESLQDLDRQYREASDPASDPDPNSDSDSNPDSGAGLTYLYGAPQELLPVFAARGWEIVTTQPPTGRYGLERRERLQDACGEQLQFVAGDGLRRDVEDTRDGWQAHTQAWFEADQHAHKLATTTVETVATGVTPARVTKHHGVEPTKTQIPVGGTERAREKLETFIERLSSYPGNISAPQDARTGTSQLSPYLKFGCLSLREVYQTVERDASAGRGAEMFRSRLYWNRHYSQKLLDWPGWTDTSVNPVMEGFNDDHHDPARVTAWKTGRTGFPMVDASMRCLVETGWLNFRMRAMCASFFADLLMQPWQIGADFFHYHLIDSDPAINYTQWQSQAGATGTNLMRIYNPRKQVRDNDPEGEFIRQYVPELRALPTAYLDQPEKTPLAVQTEVGVRIGDEYPRPIIDYEQARERIVDRYDAVKNAAQTALADPEVRRRASLSARSNRFVDGPGEETDLDRLTDAASDEPAQRRLTSFDDSE